MTHHLNDPHTQLELLRLNAAVRERKLARMADLGPLPTAPGLRVRVAGALRSVADRVEPASGGNPSGPSSWPASDAGCC